MTAIPVTSKEGPARPARPAGESGPSAAGEVVQADSLADLETEQVGEAALDHHTALADPPALDELRLVDGGDRGVPTLGQHRIGVPADKKLRKCEQVRTAVADNPGSVLECRQLCGHVLLLDGSDDVGAGRCRSGRQIGLAGHAVQSEGDGERGRRSGDGDQQQHRLGAIVADVLDAKPGNEKELSHRSAP